MRTAAAIFLLLVCAACGNVKPFVGYQPEFLPIQMTVTPSGVSFAGDTSIATFVGVFSIGATYSLQPPNADSIYVILRDRETGFDKIYEVRTGQGEFSAVVNGKTTIAVTTSRVLIDVTNGVIEKIRFKRVAGPAYTQTPTIWNKIGARWDEGWSQSWYKPLELTRWAYDDSTIGRWYGVGFAWFLLRLILAIILFFIDAVLTLCFLLGQVAFVIFGPVGRNVIYGLLVLSAIGGVAIYVAERP
jgi:hypothetical protein